MNVKHLNDPKRIKTSEVTTSAIGALAARQDRLQSVAGGIPSIIMLLLLSNTLVILAYAMVVGSPKFWFHLLGPATIAVVVLVDLSYPFSSQRDRQLRQLQSRRTRAVLRATQREGEHLAAGRLTADPRGVTRSEMCSPKASRSA